MPSGTRSTHDINADTLHLGIWQSNSVHFDQSPVLRYTLYALLLKLAGIPDYDTSFRIGLFLTSIVYYVVTPYFVYTLLSEGKNRKYAWAGIGGWLLYQLIAWPDHPIHAGKWQYAYTASLLFGSLVLANRGLQRTDWTIIRNCAVGTGIVLGVAGLTQYTYTMFAVVAITIASLRKRRFKFLGIVSVVGSVFLAYALIASSPEHFETTLRKTSEGSLGLRPLPEIQRLLFSYGLGANILKVSVGIVAVGWYVREKLMETRLFETAGLVVLAFWLFSAFTGASPGGLGYVNQFVGGTMIFVSLGYLGVAFFEKLDDPNV